MPLPLLTHRGESKYNGGSDGEGGKSIYFHKLKKPMKETLITPKAANNISLFLASELTEREE